MHVAKSAKKDEFYTQLYDIEKELKHYKDHFKDKVVLCNCDDPKESNFWRYFATKFETLRLKKLISTHYSSDGTPSYKLELNGPGLPTETPLRGDGDFRSPECLKILKEADVVVTNPPFSLFREYVAKLFEYDKKFLILGSQNAITYKEIYPLIKDNRLWTGVDNGGTKWFIVPSDYKIKTQSRIKYVDGVKMFSMGSIYWFTNMDHSKRHEEIILFRKYSPEDYPKYDNYNAIEVAEVADIPIDYGGIMGVPITFLTKYNPSQFEIVKFRKGDDNKDLSVKGKSKYFRILIQRVGA